MKRMIQTITKNLNRFKESLEECATEAFADNIFLHFLSFLMIGLIVRYSEHRGDPSEFAELESSLSYSKFLTSLLANPDPSIFVNLLHQFFTEGGQTHLVTVIATPSSEAAERVATAENELVEYRVQTLGKEGLEAAEMAQEAAQEVNDKRIPDELIENVPIPTVNAVPLHDTWSGCVRGEVVECSDPRLYPQLQEIVKAACPYEVRVYHTTTEFATIACLFPTQSLSIEEKRYELIDNLNTSLLPILFASITECPQILSNGTVRTSDEVIDLLYTQTLSCSFQLGVNPTSAYQPNRSCEVASFQLRVEKENLNQGLQLMHDVLLCSDLHSERVFSAISKVLKLLEERVHNGDNVAEILLRRLVLSEESNYNCFDQIHMRCWLQTLNTENDTHESLLQSLEALRVKLCDASHIQFLFFLLTNE